MFSEACVLSVLMIIFFFFSSRRRHTRYWRDWSSDVCSSDLSRNNVVLSRRAVLEEERKEQRQAILERLQPGLIIEGQISNIVEFGAFVDLDGIDGLIHISELSWSHVNHPSEILNKIGRASCRERV